MLIWLITDLFIWLKKNKDGMKGDITMKDLFEKLEYAKKAVKSTLESENCLVDFHGLSYWASEVERSRSEIKKML